MPPARRLLRALAVAASTTAVAAGFVAVWVLLPSPRLDSSVGIEPLAVTMDALGLDEPDFQTVVFGGALIIDAPRERTWQVCATFGTPGGWRPSHVTRAAWCPTHVPWTLDAALTETQDLGFPLGDWEAGLELRTWQPGRLACFIGRGPGMAATRVWMLEELEDGRTRVTLLDAYHGWAVAFAKPLLAGRWRARWPTCLASLSEAVATSMATAAPAAASPAGPS